MRIVYAAKELRMNFPIETAVNWNLGHCCSEVTIRTDVVSSNISLSRRVGENSEKLVSKQCTTQAQHTTNRSAGHAESGVRIVQEKVRMLARYARELHGVTSGKSHVSLPCCVRFTAEIFGRSHRGTDGMTRYRRAYGRSGVPRRCVPGSVKVFYLEQSKRKVRVEAKWHEEIFLGVEDESEIAVVGTPHGAVFARSIRRVPKEDSGHGMLFNSIKGSHGNYNLELREVENRVQLDVRAAIRERQAPAPTVGEQLAILFLHQAISGIGEVRVHGQVYRVPACEIGTEACGSQRGMPCQNCQAHDH